MRRVSAFAFLILVSCASATPLVRGHYGLQIDTSNASTIVSMQGAEDLDVTLRAAFASRFEDVDYAPRLAARDEYDAIIFVRLNFQRVAGSRNPYDQTAKRVGLDYDIESGGATFASGFVAINIAEWPPTHMTSEQVYSALLSASNELASRVAQDIARSRKVVPGRPNPSAR